MVDFVEQVITDFIPCLAAAEGRAVCLRALQCRCRVVAAPGCGHSLQPLQALIEALRSSETGRGSQLGHYLAEVLPFACSPFSTAILIISGGSAARAATIVEFFSATAFARRVDHSKKPALFTSWMAAQSRS